MTRAQIFKITFQGDTFSTCDKEAVAYYKKNGATVIATGSYVKNNGLR